MKPWGMGVIGAGIMGRRMIAGVQPHPHWQVAALWDPDAAAALAAASAAPGASVAEGLQALVRDPAVDLVYVASPPAFHHAGVAAAVAARKPVLCEKPLAHTVDEALALRDLVVASGLPFAVHFPFGRSPAATRLLELVRSGALGEIQRATIRAHFARWPRDWQAAPAPGWPARPKVASRARCCRTSSSCRCAFSAPPPPSAWRSSVRPDRPRRACGPGCTMPR